MLFLARSFARPTLFLRMALPFCFAVGGAVLAARARVRGRTKVQTTTRNTSSYWRGLVHSLLSADDNNGRSVQQEERPFRVLLCATGSVATVKVRRLQDKDCSLTTMRLGTHARVCVSVVLREQLEQRRRLLLVEVPATTHFGGYGGDWCMRCVRLSFSSSLFFFVFCLFPLAFVFRFARSM